MYSCKELQKKEVNFLLKELISLRQMQLKLIMQKASGQLKETHNIKQNRRNIARLKIVLAQKKIKV